MYGAGKANVVWKSSRAVGKPERRPRNRTLGRMLYGLMLVAVFMVTLAGQASAAPPATVKITYQTNCSTSAGFVAVCEGTASTPYGNFPFFLTAWPSSKRNSFTESWEITDPVTGLTLITGSGQGTVRAGDWSASGRVSASFDSPFASLDGKTYRNSAVFTGPNGTLNGELKIEAR